MTRDHSLIARGELALSDAVPRSTLRQMPFLLDESALTDAGRGPSSRGGVRRMLRLLPFAGALVTACFPLGDLAELSAGKSGSGAGGTMGASGSAGMGGGGGALFELCTNDRLDPGESDVDCGTMCAPCTIGKSCTQAEECASQVCSAVGASYVCGAPVVPGVVPVRAYEAAKDQTSGNDSGACRAGDVELESSVSNSSLCTAVTEPGEWIEFRVSVSATGVYELLPSVNALKNGASVEVFWDDVSLASPFVIPKRSSGYFARPVLKVGDVKQGEHVVRFVFSKAPSEFAQFEVRPEQSDALPKLAATQEFEYGDPNDAIVTSSLSGYTGVGYLSGLSSSGEAAKVVVDVAASGMHQIAFRYATPDDGAARSLKVQVSGAASVPVSLPAQAAFGSVFGGEYWLDAGPNTIVVSEVANGIWLDSVSVTDGARNLARAGVAALSSVYQGNVAKNAIDGDTSGVTYAMSAQTAQPYLEVDLGSVQCVSAVVLYPRKDCCQNRLDGSDLSLAKKPGQWLVKRPIEVGPTKSERYEFLGIEARYVRLALRGTDYLNVAEVEVHGIPGACGARPIGEIQSVRADQPTRYTTNSTALRRRYLEPVVIMGPAGYENTDIVVLRVSSPKGDGFSYRLGEWEYRNGPHPAENFNFLVVERGLWNLLGGERAIFEKSSASSTTARTTFSEAFSEAPIVLAQVASENEFALVTHKAKNITSTGFDVRLVEQATSADGTHVAEDLHYAAVLPGAGEAGLAGVAPIECASIAGITSGFRTVAFTSMHPTPAIFASVQSDVDPRAESVRKRSLSETSVQLLIEPENSAATGALSGPETLGYCAARVGTIFGSSAP